MAFASEIPDGCPVDDTTLLAAVANGQQIACQIEYFTGGKGTHLTKGPRYPNAKPSIELACIDAQDQECPGKAECYESPYYTCFVQ